MHDPRPAPRRGRIKLAAAAVTAATVAAAVAVAPGSTWTAAYAEQDTSDTTVLAGESTEKNPGESTRKGTGKDTGKEAGKGTGTSKVQWAPCPKYSPETIKELAGGRERKQFNKQLLRRECGTVSVPLNYLKPAGRQAKIAITRFPATDQKERIGTLAVNPGGPGGSGTLLPIDVALGETGELARRFDLIGFDPRGVGESTPRLECDDVDSKTPPFPSEAQARKVSSRSARLVAACAATDRVLAASLTTPNIANDLDRIRDALGEAKLSFLGISWGTGLGAQYRSLFPDRVGSMVLDSVMTPDLRLERYEDETGLAREESHRRFTAWLAQFQRVYQLGNTPAQVERTLERLRDYFTRNPQPVRGIDDPKFRVVNRVAIITMAADTSPSWPERAEQLTLAKEVADRGRKSPPPAPKKSKQDPPDLPEQFNDAMFMAVMCNEQTGTRDFDVFFQGYQRRLASFPWSGGLSPPVPLCTGWPFPPRPWRLADAGAAAPLLLVGHTSEFVTPVRWTGEMRQQTGGETLVVNDDVHGSLIGISCAEEAVSFLTTGTLSGGSCEGVPVPAPESPGQKRAPRVSRDQPLGYVPDRGDPYAEAIRYGE